MCRGGGGSFEIAEFKRLWKELFNEEFKEITEPVLSRWWTVGQGAMDIRPNWKKWLIVSQKCINAYSTIASPNLCASALFALLSDPPIKAHVCWIEAFNTGWWNTQFVFLSAVDETSGLPGFRCHHMAARVIIMKRELMSLSKNWQHNEHFVHYIEACQHVTETLDISVLRRIETEFFVIALKSFDKHFDQWLQAPMLPAMIGGEEKISVMFAKWLLQDESKLLFIF